MASDAFLEIKEVDGESRDSELPGAMHLRTFRWQLEAPFSGIQRSGAVNVGALSVVKEVDDGSVDLMTYLLYNRRISRARLVVRKSGEKPLEYYVVKLTDASVKSIQKSFEDEKVWETVALVFREFEFEYHGQSQKGGADSNKMVLYSVAENE